MTALAASILAADFAHLEDQTRLALESGAEWIHVDVMDGHFVPNITMGPLVVRALKPLAESTGAVMDVHLMIEKPERYIDEFAEAGADIISVHVETCPHIHRTVEQIKEAGARAGVTLNPGPPIANLRAILPEVDLVMIMSVNPGFAGQSFIPASLDRIGRLREMLDGIESNAWIEVDGGVDRTNAGQIVSAGANVLVSGSGIFRGHIPSNVEALRRAFEIAI